ncbi:hypothetical protein D3C86_2095240 [compost metagenome]
MIGIRREAGDAVELDLARQPIHEAGAAPGEGEDGAVWLDATNGIAVVADVDGAVRGHRDPVWVSERGISAAIGVPRKTRAG